MTTSNCTECEAEYVRRTQNPRQQTCGPECSEQRMNRLRREVTARKVKEPKQCAECGKDFTITTRQVGSKFCGKVCTDRVMHRRHYDNGGRARQWNRRWSGQWQKAMDRDDGHCVLCGSAKRVNVHHKDGMGQESDEPNHDLSNLEVLCSGCHSQQHTIRWRIVDGAFFISGPVLDRMGITSVEVER